MSYTYKYPRPAVTVDAIIFTKHKENWLVLLIERKFPPFENCHALPGGFVEMDETLEEAVDRELEEETGLKNIKMQQFHTFSNIDRDPRHRTISTVFWGVTNNKVVQAGSDAKNAKWFNINQLPKLAFDHNIILQKAVQKLLSD